MLCVVRWFQGQDGPSSCPYCRHEAGQLDNVPMAEDDEEEDEEEDSDDDDTNSESSEELEDIEPVWIHAADGSWVRYWREAEPTRWKPAEAAGAPEDLTLTATWIQAAWRGHTVRTERVADMLLALKGGAVATK